jgi:hypothetical protein
LLSLIGLLFDQNKKAAAAGLIVSGILALLFFVTAFC